MDLSNLINACFNISPRAFWSAFVECAAQVPTSPPALRESVQAFGRIRCRRATQFWRPSLCLNSTASSETARWRGCRVFCTGALVHLLVYSAIRMISASCRSEARGPSLVDLFEEEASAPSAIRMDVEEVTNYLPCSSRLEAARRRCEDPRGPLPWQHSLCSFSSGQMRSDCSAECAALASGGGCLRRCQNWIGRITTIR